MGRYSAYQVWNWEVWALSRARVGERTIRRRKVVVRREEGGREGILDVTMKREL